ILSSVLTIAHRVCCHTRTRSSSLYRSSFSPFFFFLLIRPPPRPTLFPYTTLFRSEKKAREVDGLFREYLHFSVNFYIGSPVLVRSEEHTSELQSRFDLVCRLLLEKKKERSILVRSKVH